MPIKVDFHAALGVLSIQNTLGGMGKVGRQRERESENGRETDGVAWHATKFDLL